MLAGLDRAGLRRARGSVFVLVVEDHAALGRTLLPLVREHGYLAARAATVEEIARILEQAVPSAILLRADTRGLDAWAWLAELRRVARLDRVPAVVVTAAGGGAPGALEGVARPVEVVAAPASRASVIEALARVRERAEESLAPSS